MGGYGGRRAAQLRLEHVIDQRLEGEVGLRAVGCGTCGGPTRRLRLNTDGAGAVNAAPAALMCECKVRPRITCDLGVTNCTNIAT